MYIFIVRYTTNDNGKFCITIICCICNIMVYNIIYYIIYVRIYNIIYITIYNNMNII